MVWEVRPLTPAVINRPFLDPDHLPWVGSTETPTCFSSLTPGDTGFPAGRGVSYSASYANDSPNRLTSSPLGSYTYGSSTHPDAYESQVSSGSRYVEFDVSRSSLRPASKEGWARFQDPTRYMAGWRRCAASPSRNFLRP